MNLHNSALFLLAAPVSGRNLQFPHLNLKGLVAASSNAGRRLDEGCGFGSSSDSNDVDQDDNNDLIPFVDDDGDNDDNDDTGIDIDIFENIDEGNISQQCVTSTDLLFSDESIELEISPDFLFDSECNLIGFGVEKDAFDAYVNLCDEIGGQVAVIETEIDSNCAAGDDDSFTTVINSLFSSITFPQCFGVACDEEDLLAIADSVEESPDACVANIDINFLGGSSTSKSTKSGKGAKSSPKANKSAKGNKSPKGNKSAKFSKSPKVIKGGKSESYDDDDDVGDDNDAGDDNVHSHGAIIQGEFCENPIVVNESCFPDAPDNDKETGVCENDNQLNEAYCSYDVGPNACAYCG